MKIIITALVLFFTVQIQAQVPSQPVPPVIEKEADRLLGIYNEQLVLTDVQIPLFKNKIEDYLILAENIKSEMEGRDELNALLNLQTKETLQMKNILTQNQLEIYEQMKPRVQPLKVVEE